MSGDYVLDACVAAKVLFLEQGSDAARALVGGADSIIAPRLVLLEIANVAVKKARRKEITRSQALAVLEDAPDLFDRLIATQDLLEAATNLALTSMTSTYDAIYAALAMREGLTLVTADKRFAASLRGVIVAPQILVLEGE
jgi:predicted nucleic acid-binding protein